jgi:hypothetical protein
MRHRIPATVSALTACFVFLSPPSASAGALRVGAYSGTIREIAGTEEWYGAVYAYDRICDDRTPGHRSCHRLSDREQTALSPRLSDLPRFAFVSKPKSVIRRDSSVCHNGLLVTMGPILMRPPILDHERALVHMSGYCGNLCGYFLTYKSVHGPHRWRVVGTVGGIGIS